MIYRQARVGLRGKEFPMYKFRTMVADAHARRAELMEFNEKDGVLFKMRKDPRVTRVGGILRRYSFDELPQLVNVLLGHMSLVGPRPPLPEEVAAYPADGHRRLVVKPGVTGLWQVSGRSDLSWEESLRLDLRYVDNWSLALDALIIWKTDARSSRAPAPTDADLASGSPAGPAPAGLFRLSGRGAGTAGAMLLACRRPTE